MSKERTFEQTFRGYVKTLLQDSTVTTKEQRLQLTNIALTTDDAADVLRDVVQEYERRLRKARDLYQAQRELLNSLTPREPWRNPNLTYPPKGWLKEYTARMRKG